MKALSRLKTVMSHRDFWPLVLVFFFAWLASRYLFGYGYFNMHDDLQMMRQLEMEKCFLDGQIPCRWIPDMGYGFGYPLFNFYPPLPYLTGQLFRIIGYSFVDTAKALFITAFFASGISMYYLAKKFFGRLGGVLSSIFYIWAPYHAVDVYVRGAMNEAWGMIWFPLILLFSYNLIANKNIFAKKLSRATILQAIYLTIPLALSWFALLTSHNLMVIIFTPFFALWCAAWLLYFKNWKVIPVLAVAGIWSFALAAFFTLPVFLEKSIVQTDTLVKGYYEFTAHFPSIGQLLFSRFWGYGPSVWALNDEMSFQVGWLHWIAPIIVGVFLFVRLMSRRKLSPLLVACACLFATGWIATFMAHPKSTPLWQTIQELQFIQFPWRYLTMVILGFSFVVGAAMTLFTRVVRYLVFIVLTIGVVAYGWNYFEPQNGKLGPLTDQEKFTGAAWELQQTAGIFDYLPDTAYTAPKGPRKTQADIMNGEGTIIEGKSGTNWEVFEVKAQTPITVRISVMDFPEWKVFVDGKEVQKYVPDKEEWGRLYIDIPAGDHKVEAKLYDTPIRTAGNIITLISWALLALILILRRNTLQSR